jgi:hypothetical protein
MNIDNLFLEIINNNRKAVELLLPKKDFSVLVSLATAISSNFYVTENQSRLLLKILKEHKKKLSAFSGNLDLVLDQPNWLKPFRQLEQVKKLFIASTIAPAPQLVIELTFSSHIRKTIQVISKNLENFSANINGKNYSSDLTEKNIVILYELLEPLGFDIDPLIKNHYNTIKSWSKNEVETQFLITNIDNKNFTKHITKDLGIETAIDQNIINDRSMRYQYTTEKIKNLGENLVEIIANRHKTKIWIDRKDHTLTDVIASLQKLKRLPVLVVFDNAHDTELYKNLEILSNSVKKTEIDDSVGIYFRLSNDDLGRNFNKLIADNKYNQPLTLDTKVAVVQSGKIPKFFLKSEWQPMSVIALDTKMGMRHGKTAVYANCCDLIIEWADQPTILEQGRLNSWQ